MTWKENNHSQYPSKWERTHFQIYIDYFAAPSRVSDNLTHMSLDSTFWEIGKQYSPDETLGHRNFIKNGEARRPSGRASDSGARGRGFDSH